MQTIETIGLTVIDLGLERQRQAVDGLADLLEDEIDWMRQVTSPIPARIVPILRGGSKKSTNSHVRHISSSNDTLQYKMASITVKDHCLTQSKEIDP